MTRMIPMIQVANGQRSPEPAMSVDERRFDAMRPVRTVQKLAPAVNGQGPDVNSVDSP